MKLPQIRIQSTFFQMGLNIIPPKQEIRQPQAEVSIRQPPGELKIQTTAGKLYIDQSQGRADIGILTVSEAMRQYAERGNQAVSEGTARRISEGNRMMKIENGFTAIQDIAREKMQKTYAPVWMKFIPTHGSTKLNYEPGTVDIQYTARKPEIQITPQKAIHSYTPGRVEGYTLRENQLNISFVNLYA